MQNKKLIILIVLSIAALFSLIYGIVTPSKLKSSVSRESADIKKQAHVAAAGAASPAARRPRRTSFSDWGRDPFSSGPAAFSPATVSDMVLTGILWDDTAPLAMINDNPVGVGDKITGYTVTEIRKDRVILTDGSKDFELCLPSY